MTTYYCITPDSDPTQYQDRSNALGCDSVNLGDPTQGLITLWPSIVVTSNIIADVIIPDETGEATLTEVQTAQTNATTAVTNIQLAQQQLQNLVSQMQPSIAQGQTDIVTLSGMSDPIAPITIRIIEAAEVLAQGLADTLTVLNLITTVN